MQSNNYIFHRLTVWQKWIACATALIIIYIYWPGNYYFLNDDLLHIPLAGQGIIGHTNSIRYTGDFSLMLDYWLWQKNAYGYHITNLLLHIFNSILFYVTFQKVIQYIHWKAPKYLAFCAAILFTIYGMHSDAVFWIIGRSASLGCLFFLLTIFAYTQKDHGKKFTALGLSSWILALFAYESVWILPFFLIALDFHISKQKGKTPFRLGTFNIALIVLSIVYLILRKLNTQEILGNYEAGAVINFEVKTLIVNYTKLVVRTMLPPFHFSSFYIYAFMAFILLYCWGFIKQISKDRSTLMWLHAAWLFSYLPYISLGIGLNALEGERFLYLPSLFFAICFCYTILNCFPNFKLGNIVILLFCTLHASYFLGVGKKYANAGQTVKLSFEILNEAASDLPIITINQLPQTIDGVPTFRKGFAEGYQWLVVKDGFKTATIIIKDSATFNDQIIYPVLQIQDKDNARLTFKN